MQRLGVHWTAWFWCRYVSSRMECFAWIFCQKWYASPRAVVQNCQHSFSCSYSCKVVRAKTSCNIWMLPASLGAGPVLMCI